uniref:Uncharacterized protein n=1 Tax=Rhizophora mucronata TaxID=61149 RepID=A0A2P2PX55_RHIMU
MSNACVLCSGFNVTHFSEFFMNV